jgi:hypothetical protein
VPRFQTSPSRSISLPVAKRWALARPNILREGGRIWPLLKDDDLPPLNTEGGEKWLWREIAAVKPDLIVFDSIMCLNEGAMAEEESWAPIKSLVRKISSKHVGQVWVHHTGHDTSKGFGTKTREWEMDTVVSLTKGQEDDESIALEFKKARLRTPRNRDQFESRLIRCDADGWTVAGSVARAKRGQSGEMGMVADAILSAYDALAAAEPHSVDPDGGLVVKIGADRLRGEVNSRGYLDVDPVQEWSARRKRLLLRGVLLASAISTPRKNFLAFTRVEGRVHRTSPLVG